MRALRVMAALLVAAMFTGGSFAAGSPLLQQAGDQTVEAGIRELFQQYSAAFDSLDVAAIKRVQPSINAENLKSAFKEMRALDVVIDELKFLSAEGTVTRVSCRVTQTLTPKAGSKKTAAVTRVIRLRKQNGGWIIDAFER
jgi:hypothetical protein